MTQSESKKSPHVITSLLMICNSPTLLLFYSRYTHSFVFLTHAKSLKHKTEPLESGMLINTPSGEVFVVELVCKNCKLRVEKFEVKFVGDKKV